VEPCQPGEICEEAASDCTPPPSADAGLADATEPEDAAPVGEDSGTPTFPDATVPPPDLGTPGRDSGTTGRDAATVPGSDAGSPDAGTGETDEGCGCRGTSGTGSTLAEAAFLLALLGFASYRTRRRKQP
jgi:MYXO-CTERM domain-containing protein